MRWKQNNKIRSKLALRKEKPQVCMEWKLVTKGGAGGLAEGGPA